jgi:hypothetical protein
MSGDTGQDVDASSSFCFVDDQSFASVLSKLHIRLMTRNPAQAGGTHRKEESDTKSRGLHEGSFRQWSPMLSRSQDNGIGSVSYERTSNDFPGLHITIIWGKRWRSSLIGRRFQFGARGLAPTPRSRTLEQRMSCFRASEFPTTGFVRPCRVKARILRATVRTIL